MLDPAASTRYQLQDLARALLVLVPAVGPSVSGYQLQDLAAGTYPVPWYCIINEYYK